MLPLIHTIRECGYLVPRVGKARPDHHRAPAEPTMSLLAELFRLPNMRTQHTVTMDQPIEEAPTGLTPSIRILYSAGAPSARKNVAWVIPRPSCRTGPNMNIPQFTADGPIPTSP
jgi:hypothetical protein